MPKEFSAGGVVYRRVGDSLYLLMIKDAYGKWTLPKGIIEPGESPGETALREIREETGVSGRIEKEIGRTDYFYSDRRGLVGKAVYYFLVRAEDDHLCPLLEEIRDARWVLYHEALKLNGYENNRPVLEKAIASCLEKEK